MKKQRLLMLMFASAALLFASCGKENGSENGNSDPEGTVTVNMLNNRETEVILWESSFNPMTSYANLQIDNANNLIADSYSGETHIYRIDLVDVGNITGLDRINSIPNSGWSDRAAAIPGHGYVAHGCDFYGNAECQYARLFVVDYLKNTSGEIIGAVIKYQSPWVP